MANLISLNILAVTTVSFRGRWLQEFESTGYVKVCVQNESDTATDFNVTVETLSGTAQGEEIGVGPWIDSKLPVSCDQDVFLISPTSSQYNVLCQHY